MYDDTVAQKISTLNQATGPATVQNNPKLP